jgi:hypothetical protein
LPVGSVLKFEQNGVNKVAIKLFKLASRPMPSITTSQADLNYFYTWTGVLSSTHFASGVSVTLLAANWVKGNGSAVSAFATGAGKQELEINGVMQQSGLYSVAATKVDLISPAGGGLTLESGYPITLQSYNAATFVSTTRTFAIS